MLNVLASCIEPATSNDFHRVDFFGCVVDDCDAVHMILSYPLFGYCLLHPTSNFKGLFALFRLTASGLLCRTCFAACPTRCVVSDAKGHLAAVITIRHHIYFVHLIVPLLGYCHLSLIRIGYHIYPQHTREFSEILVDFFGVFYAGKIPHLASFARC